MIQQVRRFTALPAIEKRLLLQAVAAVACVRIALWIVPFRWLCERVCVRQLPSRRREEVSPGVAAWAVRAAARRMPAATCLTQALALRWILARAGHRSTLRIGVARGGAQRFESHAWVEVAGEVLPGEGEDVKLYLPILALPSEGR